MSTTTKDVILYYSDCEQNMHLLQLLFCCPIVVAIVSDLRGMKDK